MMLIDLWIETTLLPDHEMLDAEFEDEVTR